MIITIIKIMITRWFANLCWPVLTLTFIIITTITMIIMMITIMISRWFIYLCWPVLTLVSPPGNLASSSPLLPARYSSCRLYCVFVFVYLVFLYLHAFWIVFVTQGREQVLRGLLAAGVEVNTANPLNGNTGCLVSTFINVKFQQKYENVMFNQIAGLHCAVEGDQVGVVKLLVEAGADVNATNRLILMPPIIY